MGDKGWPSSEILNMQLQNKEKEHWCYIKADIMINISGIFKLFLNNLTRMQTCVC